MKKNKIILILILLITSCVKEVNLRDFADEDKLVISSYLTTDSCFKVYLSKTFNQIDTGMFFIDGAEISIFDEYNTNIENLIISETGTYISKNIKIEEGKKYTIKTNYKEQEIWAKDSIPFASEIIELKFTGNIIYTDDGDNNLEIEITFTDDTNQSNYYEIASYIKCIDTTVFDNLWYYENEFNKYQKGYFESNDEIILCEDYELTDIFSINIFSDNCFAGNIQKIKFYYSPTKLSGSNYINDHVLKIYLRTISKNYYLYKKSLTKHIEGQYSDFWYGVANPINLYSNVNNGFGIFAGYSENCDSIVFKNQ